MTPYANVSHQYAEQKKKNIITVLSYTNTNTTTTTAAAAGR